MFRLIDAGLVTKPVKKVPTDRYGCQPVASRASGELLAILFDGRMQTHLWQQAGSRGGGLSFRQAGSQFRLARFGPLLYGLALVLLERRIAGVSGSELRR